MTKKPVLKKKVVEKVEALQEVPKVKPLTKFGGWSIRREKGKVIFGCGKVKISTTILRQLLEVVKEKDTLLALIKREENLSYVSARNLSPNELRELANIKETPNLNISFLNHLSKLTGSRYSPKDLLKLNDKTILGIIG